MENAGDTRDADSVPGLERSPGEGNGNLLQYSCLENFMGRGAWQATVHGVAKSQTRLSRFHFHFSFKQCQMKCFPYGWVLAKISVYLIYCSTYTFLWTPSMAQQWRIHLQCRSHRRHRYYLWVGKIPWRRAWQPTPVFLPGESHGQRNLEGYSQGHKESETTEAT